MVGASGQIGHDLVRAARAAGWTVVGTHCRNPRPDSIALDATDASEVRAVLARVRPSVVINAANAPGGTDACETDPSLADRSHLKIGLNLAQAARDQGARFVQISTDYVFDGVAGPYRETDPPRPLSRLGRAKLGVEQYTLEHLPDALVVRTSFVFSWTPESETKNFVMQLLDSSRRRESIRVPVDQVGNVTYSPNLASALLELTELEVVGVCHLAGTTRCSKYEWALQVADRFGLDRALIHGVTTRELGQVGPRPLQSGFVLEKARVLLRKNRLMSIDEGLAAMHEVMVTAGAAG